MTAFGVSSVKTGAQFDSSMSQVVATMGTTVDNIQNLRDFAMDMGAKTAFSATQAADALNYMALAGYDADEAMAALPNVLNLAAAGNIELAYASDMVTDAQSALGLSMEESAELVDKMAMASSKSNTSVAQLGEAILTVGGTAKTLAGGTTELSTALGILADNGVKGAEGGTALRNIILSLSAPTDTAAVAMKSLGLEVFDAEGNMRPLNETFGDLEAALSTMTQGQQTQVLNEIFNKVDLKSVNALLANTGDRFNELSGYIDNATGSAENMAATQLDNFAGDVTLLKSAVEGVQIAFSDKLSPALREGTQFLTDLAGKAQEFIENGGIEKLVQGFLNLVPAITGATSAVVAYKSAMAISSIVEAAAKTVQAYQAANEGATVAQALLNTTIMKNPFALIVSAIVAVGTALVTLYVTNEDFRNKVQEIWGKIKEIFSGAWEFIKGVWDDVKPYFSAIWDGIKTVFSVAKETLSGYFSAAWEAIKIVWGAVSGYFQNVWNTIAGIFSAVEAVLSGDFSAAWESIKGVFSGWGEYFRGLWEAVKGIFGNIASDALQWGKDLIDNFVNGIKAKIQAVKDAVSNVAGTVKSFLGFSEPEEGPLSNFHTYAPDMMKLFAKGITDNAGILKSAFDKSLDFGNPAVDFSANYTSGEYIGNVSTHHEQIAPQSFGTSIPPITIVVQSVLDGKVIGETSYNYIHNRERAYGGAY